MVRLLEGSGTEQAEGIAQTAEDGERAPGHAATTSRAEEPTTLFSPGVAPEVVAYKELPRAEPAEPVRVDRGSRAETVNYGGGLRPTSRRIATASILAVIVAAALGLTIYLVNAETADRYSAALVPANVVELNFMATAPLEGLYVVPGERVHRGQLLAVEQDTTLKLEIREQRQVVLADRLRLRYLEEPATTGHQRQSRSTVEQIALAKATVSVAVVQLAVDQSRLQGSELRSPIDGVVLHVAGTPGELVAHPASTVGRCRTRSSRCRPSSACSHRREAHQPTSRPCPNRSSRSFRGGGGRSSPPYPRHLSSRSTVVSRRGSPLTPREGYQSRRACKQCWTHRSSSTDRSTMRCFSA